MERTFDLTGLTARETAVIFVAVGHYHANLRAEVDAATPEEIEAVFDATAETFQSIQSVLDRIANLR